MRQLRYHIILATLKVIALLPFRMLYILSDLICFIMMYILHYRRKVIFGNLRRSFPEKDNSEIYIIAKKFYHHIADVIVETIKLLHISDQQLRQHIEIHNAGLVEQLASDGKPIVVFLGHYGNWEWAQEVVRYYKRPPITCELYRPVHDKVMDDVIRRIRSRFSTELIPQKKAMRKLLGMSREGLQFLVGFISDQRPYSMSIQHHWTTFLNQDTAVVTGGEEIGRHVNAHFMFLETDKPRRGYYVLTFREMNVNNDEKEKFPYTNLYFKLMEANIRRAPQYWLWSHNRWKYGRNGEKL